MDRGADYFLHYAPCALCGKGGRVTLPATPSIRRLAVAFLGLDPWAVLSTTIGSRWVDNGCEVCTDGIHLQGDCCDACGGTAEGAYWLPLDVPAGLEIAALRMDELGGDGEDVDPAEVRAYLLAHDPELATLST